MTKDKIHELIDIVATAAPWPVKSFEVRDWEFSGELQVSVTFQVSEPKYAEATAAAQQPHPGNQVVTP